ncbi:MULTISPECIES: PilN domain-containing protein [Pectobacterium]|uniref:PilN domain-containing protein n=1 Tax=Pectobacterium TaxID=122277 RepID=UPI001F481382|nr:PilN domain-containing protein [Pectobacterium sp. IFB5596]MCE9730978.1 fimbrial protein [Pectobacterium sp. IFB5596]GKW11414.1 fimbrial protein [Pectobacterium carotovorum subsp. carotovorum]
MLLINLLPWRTTQMRQRARRWLGLLWLQTGLMLCLIAASYLLFQHRQQRAQDGLDTVLMQQQQLSTLYQQTHLARETLRRFQAQERTEAVILHDNRRNLHLLEQLAGMMPARLWLTEIADRGSHLLLTGVSENYHDIITLQHALLRHVSVERIQLLRTSRERDMGDGLRFSLRVDWRGATDSLLGDDHD